MCDRAKRRPAAAVAARTSSRPRHHVNKRVVVNGRLPGVHGAYDGIGHQPKGVFSAPRRRENARWPRRRPIINARECWASWHGAVVAYSRPRRDPRTIPTTAAITCRAGVRVKRCTRRGRHRTRHHGFASDGAATQVSRSRSVARPPLGCVRQDRVPGQLDVGLHDGSSWSSTADDTSMVAGKSAGVVEGRGRLQHRIVPQSSIHQTSSGRRSCSSGPWRGHGSAAPMIEARHQRRQIPTSRCAYVW